VTFIKYPADPFSPTAVDVAHILIAPPFLAFPWNIPAQNPAKIKPQAVGGSDRGWNHRRNGAADVLDMVDVGSAKAVNFEILQK
jgi:hypothetical protein